MLYILYIAYILYIVYYYDSLVLTLNNQIILLLLIIINFSKCTGLNFCVFFVLLRVTFKISLPIVSLMMFNETQYQNLNNSF